MKRAFRNIVRLLCSTAFLFALVTVCSHAVSVSAAAKPTTSASKKTMYIGGSKYTIKLKNTTAGYSVSFTSSDEKVAKVTKTTGKVTAVSEGKAVITAKITQDGNDYSAKITITVKKPYIKFSAEAETEMHAGDTQDLSGLIDGYGVTVDEDDITYSSGKKSYAKVSADGVVTAMRAGIGKTVTITATDSKSGLSCKLKISIVEAEAKAVSEQKEENKPETDTGVKNDEADKPEKTEKTEKAENVSTAVKKYDRAKLDEQFKNAESQSGSTFAGEILTGKDEVTSWIIDQASVSGETAFGLTIKSADILLTPEEYYDLFPALKSIEFSNFVKYGNCYDLDATCLFRDSFTRSEFNVYNAFKLGTADSLDKTDRELYDALAAIVEECRCDSEADTAKKLHDWLLKNTKFSYSPFDGSDRDSVYACVMPKQCSDKGYAKTYAMLCEVSGLECITVDGNATDGSGSWYWNKVCIDGQWTNVDVARDEKNTSAPGEVSSAYFGLNDETLSSVYTTEGDDYPEATSQQFDYAYNLYADLPRASTAEELINIFKSVSRSTSYIEFVDPTGSTTLYDDNQMLIKFYSTTVGVTPSVASTSAGVYGTYYKVNLTWKRK